MGWNTKTAKSNTIPPKTPAAASAAEIPAPSEPSTPKSARNPQTVPGAPKKTAPAAKRVLVETDEAPSAATPAVTSPTGSANPAKKDNIKNKKAALVADVDEDNDDDDDEEINPFSDAASAAYANLAAEDIAAEQNLDEDDEIALAKMESAKPAKKASASKKKKHPQSEKEPEPEPELEARKPQKKRKRAESSASEKAAEPSKADGKAAPAKPKGPPPARVVKEPAAQPAKKEASSGKKKAASSGENKKNQKEVVDSNASEEKQPAKAKRAVKTKEERKQIADARLRKIGELNNILPSDSPLKQLRVEFNGAGRTSTKMGGYVTKEVAAMHYMGQANWDGATRTELAHSEYLRMYEMVREGQDLSTVYSAGKIRSFKAYNAKASDQAHSTVAVEDLQGNYPLRYKYDPKKNIGTLIGAEASMQAAMEDIGTFLETVRRVNNVDTRNLPHEIAAQITQVQTDIRNICQLNTRKLTEAEIRANQDEFSKFPLMAAINALLVIYSSPELVAVLKGEEIEAGSGAESDEGEDNDESGEEPAPPAKRQKVN